MPLLPTFDFTEASSLSCEQRLKTSQAKLSAVCDIWMPPDLRNVPAIPAEGASEEELVQLEQENGMPLLAEYREFLRLCRYLDLVPGLGIWGVSHIDE